MTRLRRRSVSWLALPLLVLALGCTPRPERFQGIVRVSKNGSDQYYNARNGYLVIRALDMQGPPLKAAMDKVMSSLDGALVNDDRNPLFRSKHGEMFLELGPDSYTTAEDDLNTALKLSEDWVPAWIALADLEARRGRLDRARKMLDGADQSITNLQIDAQKHPVPPFRILGLAIFGEDNKKDPNDPTLQESERRQLLLTWLQESEQWTIESPALLGKTASGGTTVNTGNLFRRLHARVEFERIVIKLHEPDGLTAVMPMFDKVFEWDPDLFPARIEKAAQLRRLGAWREAERMLRPYVDSADPKLANNARLVFEMASVYTDWYINSPDDPNARAISKSAEQWFVKLFQINRQHVSGWLKRAELYAVAGQREANARTLADADTWLANAREVLKKDTPETQRVAQKIADARRNFGKKEVHP
jgi:tetratricopeptide (TPR) repeat protein